ncbi:MAG: 30S ribosomal protein S20 [Clostridia bacterium]|jgi:small subunit ribosomal protein S20|nr:30S ribosomal protein S20 [Clostridia bacterium]MDD3232459.1 30S ribosomal protein S20 [Clostridia bacterium]MDD3862238.1 30S ribosomal protein S20 [Clostridia bacterium]MDD4408368.1 30S ribosomal protein S20 [Clostridia bacterium]
MPNIKSAEKRMNVAAKSRLRNRSVKSKISTNIKKFKTAVANKDVETADAQFKEVVSLLDSASQENVIHKNNASKKQAHFAKMLQSVKE